MEMQCHGYICECLLKWVEREGADGSRDCGKRKAMVCKEIARIAANISYLACTNTKIMLH